MALVVVRWYLLMFIHCDGDHDKLIAYYCDGDYAHQFLVEAGFNALITAVTTGMVVLITLSHHKRCVSGWLYNYLIVLSSISLALLFLSTRDSIYLSWLSAMTVVATLVGPHIYGVKVYYVSADELPEADKALLRNGREECAVPGSITKSARTSHDLALFTVEVDGRHQGIGFTIKIGNDVYFATAQHVVQEGDPIAINKRGLRIDMSQFGEVYYSVRDDYVLYKIPSNRIPQFGKPFTLAKPEMSVRSVRAMFIVDGEEGSTYTTGSSAFLKGTMTHSCSTTAGLSGCPIVKMVGNKCEVVGVHRGYKELGGRYRNYCAPITLLCPDRGSQKFERLSRNCRKESPDYQDVLFVKYVEPEEYEELWSDHEDSFHDAIHGDTYLYNSKGQKFVGIYSDGSHLPDLSSKYTSDGRLNWAAMVDDDLYENLKSCGFSLKAVLDKMNKEAIALKEKASDVKTKSPKEKETKSLPSTPKTVGDTMAQPVPTLNPSTTGKASTATLEKSSKSAGDQSQKETKRNPKASVSPNGKASPSTPISKPDSPQQLLSMSTLPREDQLKRILSVIKSADKLSRPEKKTLRELLNTSESTTQPQSTPSKGKKGKR